MDSVFTTPFSGFKKPSYLAHLKLLSFANHNENQILPQRNLQVPIPSDSDVSQLIKVNDSKILALNQGTAYSNSRSNEEVGQTAQLHKETQLDDKQELQHFAEIGDFYPKNLLEELTTLTARNFPNTKRIAVETIWKTLLMLGQKEFSWSQIHHELLDENRLLFVRFATFEDLLWFRKAYNISDLRRILARDDLEITYDSHVEEYIKKLDDQSNSSDSSVDGFDFLVIERDIEGFLSNKANFEQEHTNTGTEDLDKVMQYYSNYKVDNSELVDVPKNMKEKIIKDIIKFRTKVLTIEKNHRKKEIEHERRKTKQRLQNIFNLLQNNVVESGSNEQPVNDSAPVLLEDEYEELNDEEYDKMVAQKEQAKQEERYAKMLQVQGDLMRNEGSRLRNELVSLRNYEDDLIENKFKYVEQVKMFDEFKHIYRLNHSEYSKQRAISREKEEDFDKLDTESEAMEINEVDNILNNSEQEVMEIETKQEEETFSLGDVKFDEESLVKIKDYIGELIEEYLGIKEDLLIDLIYEHILQYNLSSKESLLLELREPLDDDADELVENLWQFIRAM